MIEDNEKELDKIVDLLLSPDITNVTLAWSMINGKIWESMELTEKEALGYIYAKFFKALVTYKMAYAIAQGGKETDKTGVWYAYVDKVAKIGKTKHLKGTAQKQMYEATIKVRYQQVNWLKNYALIEFVCYIWHDGKTYTVNLSTFTGFDNDVSPVWNNTSTYIQSLSRYVKNLGHYAVSRLSKLFGSWTP
jgi:hypothetical protein